MYMKIVCCRSIVYICSVWFECGVVWGGVAMSQFRIHGATIVTGGKLNRRKHVVLRTRKFEGESFIDLFGERSSARRATSLEALCGLEQSSALKKSIASVKAEIKQLLIACRQQSKTAEIDLDLEDNREPKQERRIALAEESIVTIVCPARGELPSRALQVINNRRKNAHIEIELSASAIDYIVDRIHHEIGKYPKQVVLDSDSTESQDEIVEDD